MPEHNTYVWRIVRRWKLPLTEVRGWSLGDIATACAMLDLEDAADEDARRARESQRSK